MKLMRLASLVAIAVIVSLMRQPATAPYSVGVGPSPQLPPPQTPIIPTVHVAPAVGWPADVVPTTAPGTRVVAFARGLITRAGSTCFRMATSWWRSQMLRRDPIDSKVCTRLVHGQSSREGGRRRCPSANRITLLRDADRTAVAEAQPRSSPALIHPSEWHCRRSTLRGEHGFGRALSYKPRRTGANREPGDQSGRFPAGHAEPSLDQERNRDPRRERTFT